MTRGDPEGESKENELRVGKPFVLQVNMSFIHLGEGRYTWESIHRIFFKGTLEMEMGKSN